MIPSIAAFVGELVAPRANEQPESLDGSVFVRLLQNAVEAGNVHRSLQDDKRPNTSIAPNTDELGQPDESDQTIPDDAAESVMMTITLEERRVTPGADVGKTDRTGIRVNASAEDHDRQGSEVLSVVVPRTEPYGAERSRVGKVDLSLQPSVTAPLDGPLAGYVLEIEGMGDGVDDSTLQRAVVEILANGVDRRSPIRIVQNADTGTLRIVREEAGSLHDQVRPLRELPDARPDVGVTPPLVRATSAEDSNDRQRPVEADTGYVARALDSRQLAVTTPHPTDNKVAPFESVDPPPDGRAAAHVEPVVDGRFPAAPAVLGGRLVAEGLVDTPPEERVDGTPVKHVESTSKPTQNPSSDDAVATVIATRTHEHLPNEFLRGPVGEKIETQPVTGGERALDRTSPTPSPRVTPNDNVIDQPKALSDNSQRIVRTDSMRESSRTTETTDAIVPSQTAPEISAGDSAAGGKTETTPRPTGMGMAVPIDPNGLGTSSRPRFVQDNYVPVLTPDALQQTHGAPSVTVDVTPDATYESAPPGRPVRDELLQILDRVVPVPSKETKKAPFDATAYTRHMVDDEPRIVSEVQRPEVSAHTVADERRIISEVQRPAVSAHTAAEERPRQINRNVNARSSDHPVLERTLQQAVKHTLRDVLRTDTPTSNVDPLGGGERKTLNIPAPANREVKLPEATDPLSPTSALPTSFEGNGQKTVSPIRSMAIPSDAPSDLSQVERPVETPKVRPGDTASIRIENADGNSTLVRVTVRGDQVRTNIVHSDRNQAGQLAAHSDQLRDALNSRGFQDASVSIHAPKGASEMHAGSHAQREQTPGDSREHRDGRPPDREPRQDRREDSRDPRQERSYPDRRQSRRDRHSQESS